MFQFLLESLSLFKLATVLELFTCHSGSLPCIVYRRGELYVHVINYRGQSITLAQLPTRESQKIRLIVSEKLDCPMFS